MPIKATPLPSQQELQRVLEYSLVTGKFYWRVSRGQSTKGSEAGYVDDRGYNYIRLNGRPYRAHRLAWKLVNGTDPVEQIDHIDGDPTNNAWHNLREATNQQNNSNKGVRRNNTSGFKGVSWDSKFQKFRSYININGRQTHLGYSATAEEAHAAYCEAAARHHGEFARFN